ncbi:hypothetical protein F66182_12686, partial [Fusarium sp. NRRL 66182]
MEDILDLCRDVFPWIAKLATLLGRDAQDNRFAHLGGELFILAKHIPYSDQAGISSKLFKVAVLVNKACSITAQVSRNKHVEENGLLDALQRILECMDSDPPAEEVLVRDIRRSLTQFVQQNLEYTSLLHFITECQHAMDSPDTPSDEQIRLFPKDTSYPAQVNNTLYTQLRMHSTCSCSTQHLENARLRLNPEHNTHDDENIPFEL